MMPQPMVDAPKDKNILLKIDESWIEGWWDNSDKIWRTITLPSHGCGCCGWTDPEPEFWHPLP